MRTKLQKCETIKNDIEYVFTKNVLYVSFKWIHLLSYMWLQGNQWSVAPLGEVQQTSLNAIIKALCHCIKHQHGTQDKQNDWTQQSITWDLEGNTLHLSQWSEKWIYLITYKLVSSSDCTKCLPKQCQYNLLS